MRWRSYDTSTFAACIGVRFNVDCQICEVVIAQPEPSFSSPGSQTINEDYAPERTGRTKPKRSCGQSISCNLSSCLDAYADTDVARNEAGGEESPTTRDPRWYQCVGKTRPMIADHIPFIPAHCSQAPSFHSPSEKYSAKLPLNQSEDLKSNARGHPDENGPAPREPIVAGLEQRLRNAERNRPAIRATELREQVKLYQ